jgi:hypothetical protein
MITNLPLNEASPVSAPVVASPIVRPRGSPLPFLILGVVELSVGLSSVLLSDFLPIFNLLALVSGLAGLAALAYCVFRPESVKVYDMLSAALMFGYGTGTLNSVVSFAFANQELIRTSVVSQYWFTRSLGFATAVCGLMHIIGRIDSHGYLLPNVVTSPGQRRRIGYFLIMVFAAYCLLLMTGKIGFAGSVTVTHSGREPTGLTEVSPIAVLVLALATPTGAIAFAEALKNPRNSMSVLLTFVSLVLLLLLFGLGRRVFLFSLIVYLMSALLVKRPKKVISIKNLALAILGVAILQVATTGFYALRIAHGQMAQTSARMNIFKLIPKAIEVYSNDRRGDVQAKIHENLKTRSFVLQYLEEISKGEDSHQPLYGLDFYRALVVATPSSLYEGKLRNKLAEVEEDLINPRFGLPAYDEANTILIAGLADFGVFGLFAYPIVFCVLLSLLLRFFSKRAPPSVSLLLGLVMLQILLSVEQDMAGYLVGLRNIFIITAIAWPYFAWQKRVRPPLRIAQIVRVPSGGA